VPFSNILMPVLIDSQGRPSSPALTLANQTRLIVTPFERLLNALQACSSCNLAGVAQQIGAVVTGVGTAGASPLATDQCRIQLVSSSLTGYMSVPGPVDAMFLGDGRTLNMSSSIVVELQAASVGILGDVQGNPWIGFVGGVRRQVALGPGGQ
jgi:hypothetical protein